MRSPWAFYALTCFWRQRSFDSNGFWSSGTESDDFRNIMMDEVEDDSSHSQGEKDEQYRRELTQLFKDLRSQAISNMKFYQDDKTDSGRRFRSAFFHLHENLSESGVIERGVTDILEVAQDYDFDGIPANGYRSIVKLVQLCCNRIELLSRHIAVNRSSYFFRAGHYSLELEAFVDCLSQLKIGVDYLQKLLMFSQEGDLFVDENKLKDPETERLLTDLEFSVNQEPFYGRTLGYQFCDSMKKPLETVVNVMAGYSQAYEIEGGYMKLATSLLNTGRYYWNPEQRAHQLIRTTRSADISFCKSFWKLGDSEIVQNLPMLVCPKVAVDVAFSLPPESFQVSRNDKSGKITILPPSAGGKTSPINVRLISHEYRKGQESLVAQGKDGGVPQSARSPYLLIQCHGGGWVAQSSKTHEVYLRHWAKELNAPIFCIDYSLAPEHAYPRAFEECYYFYAWAVKNCKALGSTGEVICLLGDSAGANLMMVTALKIAQEGIRQPDGIVSAYGVMVTGFNPSASRLMTAMDPLMPIGILARCVAGYTGISIENAKMPSVAENPLSPLTNPGNVFFPAKPSPLINSAVTAVKPGLSKEFVNGCCCTLNQTPPAPHSDSEDEEGEKKTVFFINGGSSRSSSEREDGKDSGPPDNDANNKLAVRLTQPRKSDPALKKEMIEKLKKLEIDKAQMANDAPCVPSTMTATLDYASESKEFKDIQQKVSRQRFMSLGNGRKDAKKSAVNSFRSQHTHHLLNHHRSPSVPSISSSIYFTAQASVTNQSSSSSFDDPDAAPQNPLYALRHVDIPKDPYLSPLFAPDDMISKLPAVYLVTGHFDPLLDDSLTLAKRIRKLGGKVHVDVLDSLPHGFLNFSLVSPEAQKGSELCMSLVKAVFNSKVLIRARSEAS